MEAAVFLPGVWAKWADVVASTVDAVEDKPLMQLSMLASLQEREAGPHS